MKKVMITYFVRKSWKPAKRAKSEKGTMQQTLFNLDLT